MKPYIITSNGPNGPTVARVAAKSKGVARSYGKSLLHVREMTMTELLQAHGAGLPIVDAETGEQVKLGASDEAAPE